MKILHSILILIVCLLLSCKKDDITIDSVPSLFRTVTIQVDFPNETIQRTSINNNINPTLKELIALAFIPKGDSLLFSYCTEGGGLYTVDNGKSYLYKLDIDKRKGNNQNFVFVANQNSAITEICRNSVGQTKEELLNKLVFTLDKNTKTLPMWAETDKVYDVTVNDIFLDKISLIRSYASIDIYINGNKNEINGLSNFKLSDVHVKDACAKGLTAPQKDCYKWEDGECKVIKTSMIKSSMTYDSFEYSLKEKSNEISDMIFLPEYSSSSDKILYILIGGYYGNDNTTTKTWYKVGLTKDGKPIELLRNRKYILNINSVNSPGANTPEEANSASGENIEVDITLASNNAYGLKHIVYNSSDFIGATARQLVLHKDKSTSFEVLTNVKSGWSVSYAPEWVELDKRNGEKDKRTKVDVKIKSQSGFSRDNKIILSAGSLSIEIVLKREAEGNYISMRTTEIITPENLSEDPSKFVLGGGLAFKDNLLYAANNYHEIKDGSFTHKPKLIVYDLSCKKIVKEIDSWTFEKHTYDFSGNTHWPDQIDDIAIDIPKNKLYVMRKHSCVEVFDISNPSNPVYYTRIGKSMVSENKHTTFRHSSAVGVTEKALLIRAESVLNTYQKVKITPDKWEDIVSKTSDTKMINAGYQPRQFAFDNKENCLWLTESGSNNFKGLYKLDISRMDNFGNQEYMYCDLRSKQISLDYNPKGLYIYDGIAYILTDANEVKIVDVKTLQEIRTCVSEKVKSNENYQYGNLQKLYLHSTNNKGQIHFWSCDMKKNNIVNFELVSDTLITIVR